MKIRIKQFEKETAPADWDNPAEITDELQVQAVSQFGLIVFDERSKNQGIYSADELELIEKACELLGFECEIKHNGEAVK